SAAPCRPARSRAQNTRGGARGSRGLPVPCGRGEQGAAAWLRVSPAEWCLIVLAIGGVLAAEVFNSALEMLARALDSGPDERIRDALDMASGGVFVTVAAAVIVGLVVFLPRLLAPLT
ncbi:MAG: diacylglycerol kinase, partial [Planctomycetia bacterium]